MTPAKYGRGLNDMLWDFRAVAVRGVAEEAGVVGADLYDQGTPIATPDLLIGGTALVPSDSRDPQPAGFCDHP